MMWVKVKSWHVLKYRYTEGHGGRTLCGLWADADKPRSDDLFLTEKSCETCLRLMAKTNG